MAFTASITGIDNQRILEVAATCRADGSIPSFTAEAGPLPYIGNHYTIYPVQYPDGTRVAVRVPIDIYSRDTLQTMLALMKAEANTLNLLARCKFAWSPRVLYYTTTFDNPLGRPYMVCTWIDGKQLEWSETFPAESENRQKILAQVARIMFDLVVCTQKSGQRTTAESFMMFFIDYKMIGAIRGQLDGIDPLSCLVLRLLARRVTEGKCSSSTFAHSHEYLTSQNIIVDNNYNVKGFVDWGFARTLPIRFTLRFPRFLSIRAKSFPPDMPRDLCGYSKAFLQVSPAHKADREFFISRIQYEFATRATKASIGQLSPLGWEMMCWDLQDVDWKHLVYDAATGMATHLWMSKRQFLVAGMSACKTGSVSEIVTADALYQEIWAFFTRNQSKTTHSDTQQRTVFLLQSAIAERLPWTLIKMMLENAFSVDQRLTGGESSSVP
ncbi:uncharacterized protein N7482_005458 [Penicillium canariense]|uniref:Aminoglycoside phosphotransferase domain-containing protein n=1 Tax=Penicillium canariense TaxID=189055 RepID=A0A9W9LMK5_9EURO|nr:uncharacterized protein N7482_005458 [Penicillium canariense]KAJ5166677.1 hypothetical protein N7482_005458 [Penicillium canariense]